MAKDKSFKFPRFPTKLFVKQERDGDDTFLVVSEDPSDLSEKDVAVPAAEYRLVTPGVVIATKTVLIRK